MDSGEIEGFVLKEVTSLNRKELGRGAYGKVYTVKYSQTVCAAKEIHPILIEDVGEVEKTFIIESFLRECRQCSMLRHPNIIQFLGVYYPSGTGGANRMRLPVMVMEMMADSLTSFVYKHDNIPVEIRYSIVHDVSLGLYYLHSHVPPIVHRDLSPNNVLLTAHHVAKISDLGVAKVIKSDSRKTMTKAPGTIDFMPPESLANSPIYGPPMDVFSFAGIILHTFNQQWPRPTEQVHFDPKTRKRVALSEVERRQKYLDKLMGDAEVLRPLVEECLDDDPAVRPVIGTVCEKIQVSRNACLKESLQEYISLYKIVKQQENENEQLKMENEQLKRENKQLKRENEQQRTKAEQMYSARSIVTQEEITSQLNRVTSGERSTVKVSKLKTEAPPLMPTLASGKYHIKWTQLADLPVPLYAACVAVQDKKVYVAGGEGPVEDAKHQVYVYNLHTDHWGQLPLSGHYYGTPHIIGGRLAIIGGRLSATKKMTNKVSTFDEDSQTWKSYYPDMLSVRSKPGVVSHLRHVIVAGGAKCYDDALVVQDDIEVLDWIENLHWKKLSINLPVPMYGFTPTICDDHIFIVGYDGKDKDKGIKRFAGAYKITVANITASINQQHHSAIPTNWSELTLADHRYTILIPNVSPPMVVGGEDMFHVSTADIKMYDNSNKSWKRIGSLSSARSYAALVTVFNNGIIIIGGCAKGGDMSNAKSSSLTVVELGQAELSL